jgi:hypothetical protein
MPVVAVAGAIYAGSTIATVGIAAMTTMQVVSAVGAIAAGVGAITGNKTLMQIGGVASLAGGIGSFAQGQGWMSGGAADIADASNTSKMMTASSPGVADPSAAVAADTGAALAGETSASLATDPGAANYTNQMDMASDAAAGAGNVAGTPPTGLVNATAGDFARADRAIVPPTSTATATSSSIFGVLKDVGSFMKDNKELASLGLNFVGGMFDDKKKAEAELYGARADKMRKQMANASAIPDITGLKVNPAARVFNTAPPPVYQAPRPGLINSTGR